MDPGHPSRKPTRCRLIGLGATTLLHLALWGAWHAALDIPAPVQAEPSFVQWVRVQQRIALAPTDDLADPVRHGVATDARSMPSRPLTRQQIPVKKTPGITAHAAPTPPSHTDAGRGDAQSPPATDTAQPSDAVRTMIEQARRDVREIDRELRKQRNPLIALPPDSPQIRMAKKFREAAALAPNRLWEAPKIVELVNDGGDGARRTRVLTAAGIYCITERSPATSIDMIERHGKQRITNCGHEHEQPANPQEWRTVRE